ncbi:F-box protein CPR1-like [Gastrolobium bilobum]|uniref:F-box protein CPR1-like n=1 Tax=Gastrolobium bilobum TaxID=150636 RepID=UPI002AB278E7|nr:F-box protein CPR1-like [Gastrolobium bilobum]
MADCIPEDIMKEILLRLDPKSIGKCMSVCKSWNILIKSHHFLSSYQPRTPLFLVRPSDYVFSICSPQNIEYSYLPLSGFSSDIEYRFVGAVKGLVCLSSYDPRFRSHLNFILFNPLTRRSLRLPISKTLCRSGSQLWFGLGYGFGFDSKKNDFKVVQMSCIRFKLPPKVELYSLNEGAWRVLNTQFDQDFFNNADDRWGNQLFFHDSVHWLVCRWHGLRSSKNYHIVMFNVVEEKFSKTELPQVLARSSMDLEINVIDGCLSLIEYHPNVMGYPRQPGDTNIWMKRESWSKIYSVSLSGGNTGQLLVQSMNSEIFVLLTSHTACLCLTKKAMLMVGVLY